MVLRQSVLLNVQILTLVRQAGTMARWEIGKALNLDQQAVAYLCREMVGLGELEVTEEMKY